MKKFTLALLFVLCISCNQEEKVPDVSAIKIDLSTKRFEKDFFSIDTNLVDNEMQRLYKIYGNFTSIFVNNILALSTNKDSIKTTENAIKLFIKTYKNVYDSTQKKYFNFEKERNDIVKGFQFIRYYFPNYKIPKSIITFVGPIDGVGIGLTENELVIGLQMYMGKNFVYYKNEYIRSIYPEYKSNRFEPEYIAVNAMSNIIDDMYPENLSGKALIDLMIDEGKKIFVLKKFLPNSKEYRLIGYTEEQLKGCYNSEASIWNFFVVNDLLFQNEYQAIKDYVNDGPKTQALGNASPGYIAKFVGYRIVSKWVNSNKISLEELMKTPTRTIYEEAKYKPK